MRAPGPTWRVGPTILLLLLRYIHIILCLSPNIAAGLVAKTLTLLAGVFCIVFPSLGSFLSRKQYGGGLAILERGETGGTQPSFGSIYDANIFPIRGGVSGPVWNAWKRVWRTYASTPCSRPVPGQRQDMGATHIRRTLYL